MGNLVEIERIWNAFLKRLRFQLDFLSIEDQEVVLSFYENKIQSAETLTHEEEIVRSFGSPEFIAEKLKKIYFKHLRELQEENNLENTDTPDIENGGNAADHTDEANSDKENTVPSEEETVKEDVTPSNEEEATADFEIEDAPLTETDAESNIDKADSSEEDDLIFSRAESHEHYSEVVHTIEYDDVVPIYGEKVAIAPEDAISEEPDSADAENGFTPEEIEEAKKETLQKAEDYTTESFAPVIENKEVPLEVDESKETKSDEVPMVDSLEDDPDQDNKEEETKEEPVDHVGLFNKPFYQKNTPKGIVVFANILFTILLSPILLAGILSLTTVFSVTILLCFITIAALFLIDLGAIIGGCIELAYGFTLIFDAVSVALIEIGIGTALFGIVVAFSALIHEFLRGIMPKVLKFVTRKFKSLMRKFLCAFYGGKA